MGKITLIVLVLLIGFGGYWFYWEESGANAPITISYNADVKANLVVNTIVANRRVSVPIKVDGKCDIVFFTEPDKAKFDFKADLKELGKLDFVIIARFDQRKFYRILPQDKIYCVKEFEYIPLEQTEKPKEGEVKWLELFEPTLDGKSIGEEKNLYFCRKLKFKESGSSSIRDFFMRPGLRIDFWFTDWLTLGSRHMKTINKFTRIDLSADNRVALKAAGYEIDEAKVKDRKVTLLDKKDLPYFPLPLIANIGLDMSKLTNGEATGGIAVNVVATEISRKKLNKSTFTVPEDFSEVSEKKFTEALTKKGEEIGFKAGLKSFGLR